MSESPKTAFGTDEGDQLVQAFGASVRGNSKNEKRNVGPLLYIHNLIGIEKNMNLSDKGLRFSSFIFLKAPDLGFL